MVEVEEAVRVRPSPKTRSCALAPRRDPVARRISAYLDQFPPRTATFVAFSVAFGGKVPNVPQPVGMGGRKVSKRRGSGSDFCVIVSRLDCSPFRLPDGGGSVMVFDGGC